MRKYYDYFNYNFLPMLQLLYLYSQILHYYVLLQEIIATSLTIIFYYTQL